MIFYIVLFLIILAIVIWGSATRWRFIKGGDKLDDNKEYLDKIKPKSVTASCRYDGFWLTVPLYDKCVCIC